MKETGFFGKLGIALFKPSDYRRFVHLSTGKVIGFFLAIILIFCIIAVPRLAYNTKRNITKLLGFLKGKVPTIVLENRQFSSDVRQPYEIFKRNNYSIVLDTTGATREINEGILIQNDGIVLFSKPSKTVGGEESVKLPLSLFFDNTAAFRLDNAAFDAFDNSITVRKLLVPIFISVFIGYLTVGFLWLFFASIPAWIFNRTLKANLSYGQVLTLEVFALAPALAIKLIFVLLGVNFSNSFRIAQGLMILVYMIYLWIAIKKIGTGGGLLVTATSGPEAALPTVPSAPPDSSEPVE
ncbi:MAG: DUF1189 domain-containing protein [Chloroflexi bacterium]|nr:DUF1189 domain-containing protein [Chloroflexota bacterium]